MHIGMNTVCIYNRFFFLLAVASLLTVTMFPMLYLADGNISWKHGGPEEVGGGLPLLILHALLFKHAEFSQSTPPITDCCPPISLVTL